MNIKRSAATAGATAAILAGSVLATAPAASADGIDTVSSVTPSVGVDFRDDHGNRTSSGLSNRDQFEYLNARRQGRSGDGMLIKVRQITHGKGGWGPLYTGWIPVKYTQLPSMFKG